MFSFSPPPPPPYSDSSSSSNGNNSPMDASSPSSDTGGRKSKSKAQSADQFISPTLAPSESQSYSHFPSLSGSSSEHSSRVVGAAVGSTMVLAMIAVVVVCVARKKHKGRQGRYYGDESREIPNAFYASKKGQNWNQNPQNWNNYGQNWNQMMKFPSQSASVNGSSEYGWQMPPPPPPPPPMMMSSAGYSSSPLLPPPHPGVVFGMSQSNFSYEELAAATNGFARSNMLGQGGFGYVYKGVLPNGKQIAVKSLKANSGQGEREFQAEVDTISRVHHRHLVSLVGYCTAGSRRMLVYEFVPNDTLESHLHGSDRPPLEWSTRLKIALGAAKGFAYLHEDCQPRIIHRDIKASNILLDSNFEAKVSDFGLAKLSQDTNTHVSTRIMGTFGYLAPEYASTGKLTEKSDVYSFGIMLMELITGRRPVDLMSDDEDSLLEWAMPLLERAMEGENYDELVDPRLGNNYDQHEMYRMVCCAAACIRHSARKRPKMSQVVRALEGAVSLEDLSVKQGTALMGSRSNSELDFKPFEKANGAFSPSPASASSNSNEISSSNSSSSSEQTLKTHT